MRWNAIEDRVRRNLKTARAAMEQNWYPYDSLANLPRMAALLPDQLLEPLKTLPAADVGCGDGDVAFFLEALGFQVDAVDYPATNYNKMEGVYQLRKWLASSITITQSNIDRNLTMPSPRYGLALSLGLLYHLRNPFQFLDTLAERSLYCLLSTRVTSALPGLAGDASAVAAAYLSGSDEINDDPTNFWFFTPAGLERLFARTNWRVTAKLATGAASGDTGASDARAFYLLESALGTVNSVSYLSGWHELEYETFRWSAERFTLWPRRPARRLTLRFHIPELAAPSLPLTLTSTAGEPRLYSEPGQHTYECAAPNGTIEFTAQYARPLAGGDERSLGVLAHWTSEGAASLD